MTVRERIAQDLKNNFYNFDEEGNGCFITSGYMVSLRGFTTVGIDSPYIDTIISNMSILKQAGVKAYIGAWTPEWAEDPIMDLSINVQDRAEAVRLGKLNEQYSIYDLENNKEIVLEFEV